MKNRIVTNKALSQVITTLIILVVAVLLTGVVTYYATNITMTRTTQEEVRIRKPHVWVQEGDNAYAALMVQNLGGRDVLIDKVTIRGVDAPWGSVSVDVTENIGIADGSVTPTGNALSKVPIIPESITITVLVASTPVEITDTDDGDGTGTFSGTGLTSGNIDYDTGVWDLTFTTTGPDLDSLITAEYTYTFVMVKYYKVQGGDDVSNDFKLKKDALDVVFAQIGTVPADADGWLEPTTDIPLKSSGSILFFIKDPANIALNDVGTTISITIFTSNAQWIIETVVQAAEIEPIA